MADLVSLHGQAAQLKVVSHKQRELTSELGKYKLSISQNLSVVCVPIYGEM
jgi:hypothetical protein